MAGKTIKFSGKGTAGDLLDGHNWGGKVVPGVNDTALIEMNVGGPVSGTFDVNNVMLLGTEVVTFTGTLDTAGVGNCQGLMVCDGAVAIFAPGEVLNDGNVLIVGNDAVGTLEAQGSGATRSVLNTVSGVIGKQDAGVGTVSIDDAVWRNSGHLLIGDAGSGTLNVANGGSVAVGAGVQLGIDAGSAGTLAITGGASVAVTGGLTVGGAGVAQVSVGSGSTLTVGKSVSVGAGSVVTLDGGTVSGGDTKGSVGVLPTGVISGFGTLVAAGGVSDAGTIVATGGTLDVAGNIGGPGTIDIAGNGTALLTGGSLKLASIAFIGADGTLALSHGATVTSPISDFAIGDMITTAGVDAVSFNASTGVLKLIDAGVTVEKLHFVGGFAGDVFSVSQSGGVGVITLTHS